MIESFLSVVSGSPCLDQSLFKQGIRKCRCFNVSPLWKGEEWETNAALNVYLSKKGRIRDIYEYYTGTCIPPGYEMSAEDGFYSVRDNKKLTFRQRGQLKRIQPEKGRGFLLGIENQMTVNLTFAQRLF